MVDTEATICNNLEIKGQYAKCKGLRHINRKKIHKEKGQKIKTGRSQKRNDSDM